MSKSKAARPESNTKPDGQMLLGSSGDGFIRPLKETDQGYLKAQKACEDIGLKILSLQEQIKGMKDEAMEPIKDDLKEYTSQLDALEHLYSYRRLDELMEEARVRSQEENATFVVWVISQKLTKLTNWCFVGSKEQYRDDCAFRGPLNVFKVGEYAEGLLIGEEKAKEDASATVPLPDVHTHKEEEGAA